ncbi:MAG: NAD(P)H-dependent glycerol-3-phosphate dehydrogenase [Burkholderiaceae bacterium]
MNLSVLGAGAWGTALAVSACARIPTVLWARDAQQAARMNSLRRNQRYLDGVDLPVALRIGSDLGAALDHGRDGLIVIATPMAALDTMLRQLPPDCGAVLWLCKGFQEGSGWLGHEVAQARCPQLRVGVLSGPSFALEVARGQPTALVAASEFESVRAQAVRALHSDVLRVYTSNDPVGVEVGGAVKNVLAIATGIADAMPGVSEGPGRPSGLGQNARAALITRGLAEMTRLGLALGARAETFTGLSGLGDLVLTATGDLSRNRTVGMLLAQGLDLPEILRSLGHVAEGVYSAAMVLRRAKAHGVEMPITQAVVAVLEGRLTPRNALDSLMGREARPEATSGDAALQ